MNGLNGVNAVLNVEADTDSDHVLASMDPMAQLHVLEQGEWKKLATPQ